MKKFNLENNIKSHSDVREMLNLKEEKIKYFKVFRAVMIFIGFIGVVFIGISFYCLNDWNTEQLLSITN